MRWVQLVSPEGAVYIDVATVDAIGPPMTDSVGGRTMTMRALYLRGGQLVAILDTPDNMEKLFQTHGVSH